MSRLCAVALAMLMFSGIACADRIWLKSGISIDADKVITRGDVVEYVVGSTKYTLNKSDVSRIESSGSFGISVQAVDPSMPQRSGPSASATNARVSPAPRSGPVSADELNRNLRGPQLLIPNETELLSRILNLNRVDDRALQSIEKEGDPRYSAVAYAVASQYEFKHNNVVSSRNYAGRAVELWPDNVTLLCWHSTMALQSGQNADAIASAQKAVDIAPESADALRILGFAFYQSNRTDDAVRTWKRALQIAPDEFTQRYLEKAEREDAVEANFNEHETQHFTLRYQGRQTGFTLRTDLLLTLEDQYRELSRELGAEPASGLTVILYTEKEFFDVTQAPSWAGAMNDGKLRIPVKNVSAMTPELQRVLKHELSHSFIHFITRGRCPLWVNEGIAQMMEPQSTARYGRQLAELFRKGKQAPLRELEAAFTGLDSQQATLAYVESLAAVEYILSAYGMRGLQEMLSSFAEGERAEDAVHSITQRNYPELETDIGKYLARTYAGQ